MINDIHPLLSLYSVAVLSGGDQVVSGEAAIDAAALQASFGKLKGVQFHSIPLVKEQRHLFELLEDALIRG